jgi:hypothetical protein
MISLTLSSRKGTDNTTYPDSSVLTSATVSVAVAAGTSAAAPGGTSFVTPTNSPNSLIKIGDTFVYPAASRFINGTFTGTIVSGTAIVTLVSTPTSAGLIIGNYLYWGSSLLGKILSLTSGTANTIGATYTLSQILYDLNASTLFSMYSNAIYNITALTHSSTNTTLTFFPNAIDGIPAGTVLPITTIHSSTLLETTRSALLGYKVAASNAQSAAAVNSTTLDITNAPYHFSNTIVNHNSSVIVEKQITMRYKQTRQTYAISNLIYNYWNKVAALTLATPTTFAIGATQNVLHFYSRTANNMRYTIDPTIFRETETYEVSFSFASSACILNQGARCALVYATLGSDKTYDNTTGYTQQSNFLGFLKIKNVYESVTTVADTTGSVSYSTLYADPSNPPIIIKKPISNTINITILNEDGTLFTDNSNIRLMPQYLITLYFKELA